MTTFTVRYIVGHGPVDTDDVVEVRAAIFKTNGDFTDFYSTAARNVAGGLNASGDVVMRVRNDLVADIRQTES